MARENASTINDDGDGSLLDAVIRYCGEEAAERLCAEYGGVDLMIPRLPKPHHIISSVLGVEGVCAIVKAWGWGRVSIPLGTFATRVQRKRQAITLFKSGASLSQVARELGVSSRTARRYRREFHQIPTKA